MSEFDNVLPIDGTIEEEYHNYVYTVVEHTTKVQLDTVKRKNCDYSVRSYNVLEFSDTVVRSYANKIEAEKMCAERNCVDCSYRPIDYIAEWAIREFGTNYVLNVSGPDNFAQIVTIHKFYYVENELFGSVLEKEQSWN